MRLAGLILDVYLLQRFVDADAAEQGCRIYRKTGSLRAVQPFLGHTKLESSVRYLGTEVDDAPVRLPSKSNSNGSDREPSDAWSLSPQADVTL